MFGYTLSEMIASPPDSVRGVTVAPQSLRATLSCATQSGSRTVSPFPTHAHRLSAAHILIPTLWYFPHVLVFHLYREKLFLEKSFEIEDVSQKDSENA